MSRAGSFSVLSLQGVKKDETPARSPEVQQAVTLPPVLSPQLSDFSLDLTRIRKGQGRSLLGEERDDCHDLRSAGLVEAVEEILYRAPTLIVLKELDRPGRLHKAFILFRGIP